MGVQHCLIKNSGCWAVVIHTVVPSTWEEGEAAAPREQNQPFSNWNRGALALSGLRRRGAEEEREGGFYYYFCMYLPS